MKTLMALVSVLFVMNIYSFAQSKDSVKVAPKTEETVKDKAFLGNYWGQIQKVSKESDRKYKVESPQPVAGVRGKAEDETLSSEMYYKGGERYPRRSEVMAAIEMLQGKIESDAFNNTQKGEFCLYIGQCYQALNDLQDARVYYQKVVDEFGDSDAKKQAEEFLKGLE